MTRTRMALRDEWELQFEKLTEQYTAEQKEYIALGLCPMCHPEKVPYRILTTEHCPDFGFDVHRVKCMNVVICDWDGMIPAVRPSSGLDDFFHS
ncbi:MAG: hypothetical protein K6T63_06565 [Alicyclobacillus herbarius]|uniref:hypothetical protein n=1 Tax=Alicyclobacillus herbarius TaxID=122960 RepID=UPI0004070503|nr:hypothetical protein [Alicyclobacillus herbarius]MCL6632284.1 hypothetical protein [Alicyclobacillus herbarius]